MSDSADPTRVPPIHTTESREQVPQPPSGVPLSLPLDAAGSSRVPTAWEHLGDELFAWLKTVASAALYATLIITFVFQVARVEGRSMAPTLEDHDRLIINKFAYRIDQPHLGDIVMLYYPSDPSQSFVKRLIAAEGD